jgi:hypothetical protein
LAVCTTEHLRDRQAGNPPSQVPKRDVARRQGISLMAYQVATLTH